VCGALKDESIKPFFVLPQSPLDKFCPGKNTTADDRKSLLSPISIQIIVLQPLLQVIVSKPALSVSNDRSFFFSAPPDTGAQFATRDDTWRR
jgi:hypothetical protein